MPVISIPVAIEINSAITYYLLPITYSAITYYLLPITYSAITYYLLPITYYKPQCVPHVTEKGYNIILFESELVTE
jgi:hypothetical protein